MKRQTIDVVLFCYLLVLLSFFKLANIPELAAAVFVVPTFLIFPYLTGKYILIFARNTFLKVTKEGIVSEITLFWLFGTSAIFLASFFFSLLGIFNVYYVGILLLVIVASSIFINRRFTIISRSTDYDKVAYPKNAILKRNRLVAGVSILILGLVKAIYIRSFSAFPLQPALDPFSHMIIITGIELGKFSIFLSSYSSSFLVNAYLPIYHLLFASVQSLFGANSISIFWMMPFLMLPLFGIGIFLLSFKVSKNLNLAFLSAVFGLIFIEYGRLTNVWVFLPSTVVMLLAPFYLYVLIDKKITKDSLLLWLVPSLIIISFSFFTGTILAICGLFVLFFNKYYYKSDSKLAAHISILAICIAGFLFIEYLDIFRLENLLSFSWFNTDPTTDYLLNFDSKLEQLNLMFNGIIFLLAFIGAVLSFFSNKAKIELLGILFIFLTFLYFLPASFSMRAGEFLHILVAFFGAYVISKVIKMDIFVSKKWSQICLITIVVVFSVIVLVSLSSSYFSMFSSWNYYDDSATSFSYFEKDMGGWLENNTALNTIIVSEPETQNILGGFSNRETIKGPYMSVTEQILLKEAILTGDANRSNYLIKSLVKDGESIVVIVSGRVFWWANQNNRFTPVYGPHKFEMFDGFSKFYDEDYFEFLHDENKEIYAFKLK
ncbi:MAG: hypothetical protein V1494_03275 [Candidatus Diapherotrites archaeon]